MSAQPRILIVEDEGIVALNLQQRLQQMGYVVTGMAESGTEGLSLASRQRPDLVLMDIHIKGEMDGIELARMLTREHALPIVYLTAYSEDTTLERARQTRPYGYLIKPFSERELHATIQMALERHSVQQALAESQQLLAQALDAAQMGAVEIDVAQAVVRIDGAPAALLGMMAGVPQSLAVLLDKLNASDRDWLMCALTTEERQRRAVHVTPADAPECWLQLDLAPQPGGLLRGVAQDVTERERARHELLLINESLEERVMERTAELRQHVRELEAFSHTAAHDLRSPVRAIAGLGEVLLELHGDALGEEGRTLLERMRHSALRMGELVEALMSLSKLSRAPMHPQPIDLTGLAREAIAQLRESEPHRAVEVSLPDQLPAVADPVLMRSVIDNLLRNAWKFTRDSQPARIELSARALDGKTVYEVRDNGCGFAPEYAQKLFDPFFRLHSDQAFGGTGLGLNIAQRILERHGGAIWAEGAPGQGATIRFTLGA